jgi:hypothetical protein
VTPPRTPPRSEIYEPDEESLDGIGRYMVKRQRSLTASAVRPAQEGRDSRKYKRITQQWQDSVFTYYHTIPECWYGAQFYARSLSQLRLFVGRRDEQGEIKELPKTDPASKLLDRIRDPSGGKSQLLGSYGRLRFLIGECFLVCTIENGVERWEALSNKEIRQYDADSTSTGPRRYVRVRAPGLDPEDLADNGEDEDLQDSDVQALEDGQKTQLKAPGRGVTQALVWRLWRRDPEYSSWADSPTRSVLDLFEELLLLQLTVRARLKSRLANAGILLLAQELDFGPTENKTDAEDQKQEPFIERLQRAMVTPIKDPGSVRQVVPIVGRIPAELIDNAYALIKIHDPNEKIIETEQIDKLLFRIATGLDMPAEQLLGMGDVNHWGTWQIDESSFKQHIRPVAQELVDDVTSAYLIPAAMLDDSIEDPQDLVVGYDAAALVNHPDKSKDAKELRALGAVNLGAVREATGFNDNDAIDWKSDDEQVKFDREIWLAQTFGDPQLLPESIRPEKPEPVAPADGGPVGDPQDKAPPDREDSNADEQKAQENEQDQIAAASVLASAALTARRARELAGSRLRSRVNGDHRDTPNTDLAAALGREKVEAMGLTAAGLVHTASDLFTRHLVDEGIEPKIADKLGEMVEQYAAQTLFDEIAKLPNTFGSYVRRVV